jgi:hypothetical protein
MPEAPVADADYGSAGQSARAPFADFGTSASAESDAGATLPRVGLRGPTLLVAGVLSAAAWFGLVRLAIALF